MTDPRPRTDQSRPRHRSGGAARVPIVVILASALILGGLIDRTPGSSSRAAASSVQPGPVAAPPQALSSSWFCAGATDQHGVGRIRGAAPGAVVIANSGPTTVTGVVTLVPTSGSSVRIPVSVGPDGHTSIAEDVPGGAPWIGAIVDINAGSVAVDQLVDGSLGEASAPCATAGSSQWYFATGATLINAAVVVSLLNPYPSDAVVDMSFTTSNGLEQPQEFQAVVVPAGELVTVNLGDHLRRRQAIAATITARSGRIVAWKTDVVTPPASGAALLGTPAASNPLADPAAPIPGVTLTLGVPAPATTWTWPDGVTGNGVDEQYMIYNPGPDTAQMKLSLNLDQGTADPFDLSVGPYQVNTVVSSQEVRIPPGVGHSAVLESTNGVGVVAVRTIAAAAPSAWSGLGELSGGQVAAAGWLVGSYAADGHHAGSVVVYNPGSAAARVVLQGLDGSAQVPLDTVVVGPDRRASINLNNLRPVAGEPLLITASAPIYVESDSYGIHGSSGISLGFGVPLTP